MKWDRVEQFYLRSQKPERNDQFVGTEFKFTLLTDSCVAVFGATYTRVSRRRPVTPSGMEETNIQTADCRCAIVRRRREAMTGFQKSLIAAAALIASTGIAFADQPGADWISQE